MQPCLSEATLMPCSFADDVAHAADAGFSALEVWLTKLETHLQTHSLDQTRALLTERAIRLVAASFQGGLLTSEGEKRSAHFEHFRRRLEICQALSIPTLIVSADFREPVEPARLEHALRSLQEAAQWAAAFDVKLALELQAKATFCASLDTALSFIEQCGEGNLGLNLDVFHFTTGPSKLEDMALIPPDKLLHVQLCDVAGMPRELATDADRILPGDGDFRLDLFVAALRGLDYAGHVSLELMNPRLWQTDPSQVARVGFESLRRTLSQVRLST